MSGRNCRRAFVLRTKDWSVVTPDVAFLAYYAPYFGLQQVTVTATFVNLKDNAIFRHIYGWKHL